MERINLTPDEVAARLRTTRNSLANWRVRGYGPQFIKVGRRVLYPLVEVQKFERDQLRRNTA